MRILVSLATALLACVPLASALQPPPVHNPTPYQQYLGASYGGVDATDLAPEEWWNRATALGYKLQLWTDKELAKARDIAGAEFDSFKEHAKTAASAARRLGDMLAQKDKQEINDALAQALSGTLEEMRNTFPPPDEAQGHENRTQNVRRGLEMAKEKVIVVLRDRFGLDEGVLRSDLGAVFNALENMIVTAGDIVEQHPVLAETFVIVGSVLLGALIPEWFIFRPLLSLFGFGPLGPVKGSAAAWAQRYFWGAAVAEGSWFAVLQRAGMVGIGWFSRIIGGLIGGLIAAGSTWSCFGVRA